jgi:hypothetical protein
MSSSTINTELRTHYNLWVDKPVTEFPNELFTPLNPVAMWARFTILLGEELRMDIGTGSTGGVYRLPGVLIVQLFYPQNKGNGTVLSKADSLASHFRNWCGSTITCEAATVEEIGNENGYFQVNVTIPFRQDNVY